MFSRLAPWNTAARHSPSIPATNPEHDIRRKWTPCEYGLFQNVQVCLLGLVTVFERGYIFCKCSDKKKKMMMTLTI